MKSQMKTASQDVVFDWVDACEFQESESEAQGAREVTPARVKAKFSAPMENTTKSTLQVRREFERKGIAIAAWERDHKVSRSLVYEILAGRKKCHRGQSHKISVLLGLKRGQIVDSTAAVNDAERRAA